MGMKKISNKSRTLVVRLRDDQFDFLETAAKDLGLSVSVYLRLVIDKMKKAFYNGNK